MIRRMIGGPQNECQMEKRGYRRLPQRIYRGDRGRDFFGRRHIVEPVLACRNYFLGDKYLFAFRQRKDMVLVLRRTITTTSLLPTQSAMSPDADCILLVPQVWYKLNEVKNQFPGKPVMLMEMSDYGMLRGGNVLKAAKKLMGD